MGHGYGWDMGWGGGGWGMWVLMLAGIIGFWVLVVYVVRALTRERGVSAQGSESALSVLDRRLAAGEIDTEEYQRIRRVLTGGH